MEMQNGVEKWKYPSNRYHVAQVWKEIRIKKTRVNRHRLIWASFVMPKHTLIAWMTITNRLPTKDRLKSWGLEMDDTCVLCKQEGKLEIICFLDAIFHKKFGIRF